MSFEELWRVDGLTLLTIVGMALVTYLTRVSGIWVMSRVAISGRVEAGLRQVPSAVLISIILPGLIKGGPVEWLGATITALVAWRTAQLLPALGAGLLIVVGARLLGF